MMVQVGVIRHARCELREIVRTPGTRGLLLLVLNPFRCWERVLEDSSASRQEEESSQHDRLAWLPRRERSSRGSAAGDTTTARAIVASLSATTSPFALLPLCPCETKAKKDSGNVTKGQIIKHACLGRHRENPALRPGYRGRKAKRARAAATDGSESVGGSEDEEEHPEEQWGEEDEDEAE